MSEAGHIGRLPLFRNVTVSPLLIVICAGEKLLPSKLMITFCTGWFISLLVSSDVFVSESVSAGGFCMTAGGLGSSSAVGGRSFGTGIDVSSESAGSICGAGTVISSILSGFGGNVAGSTSLFG